MPVLDSILVPETAAEYAQMIVLLLVFCTSLFIVFGVNSVFIPTALNIDLCEPTL